MNSDRAPDAGGGASAGPLLALESVTVTVGERPLLDDVSLVVAEGEALAVVGPNGAGKTTLLRSVLGMLPLAAGHILLQGRPLRELRPRERARRLSYVPQLDGRPLPFRVRAFVEMGRYPHQDRLAGPTAADREAVDRALAITGLADLADRRLATLSGGERQQAFIAAAIAQGGEILLLDEPTAFLDYAHQVRVHEILATVRAETRTAIVLVTHDVNEALAVADRAVALGAGRVVASGGIDILTEPEVLARVFGVAFSGVHVPGRAVPWMVPERREEGVASASDAPPTDSRRGK